MQTSAQPTKIKLNIIWIGDVKKAPNADTAPAGASAAAKAGVNAAAAKAAASAPLGVAGHDTQAAIEMAARINNQTHEILFWCLDEQFEHYAKTFQAQPNISVYGVRGYLAQDFGDAIINNAANRVLDIIDILLKPERNTVRDRVTVKEAFSLFLLLSLGDYILDSNVRPTDKLNLTRFNHFYMPCLFYADGSSPKAPDVWMMFSPPKNNQAACAAFNDFSARLQNIENTVFAKEAYSPKYYQVMGDCIVTAALKAKPKYWKADLSANDYKAYVKQLGICKYYFNTHKYETRSAFESDEALARTSFHNATASQLGLFSAAARGLIFDYFADAKSISALAQRDPIEIFQSNDLGMAIELGLTTRVDELLAMKVDVNQLWSTDAYKDLSPLYYAILERQLGCAESLLKAGARVDLKVTRLSDNAALTALELIQLITRDNVRQEFISLYQRYHPDVKAKPYGAP